MDESESLFIKMAHANMDAKLEGPVKAFFWLALEAIRQLTRIADSNKAIADRAFDALDIPHTARPQGIYPEE